MKLSHELLKSILVKTPPQEDRRSFLVRLLSSFKFGLKIKRGHDGKITKSYRVGAGTDF